MMNAHMLFHTTFCLFFPGHYNQLALSNSRYTCYLVSVPLKFVPWTIWTKNNNNYTLIIFCAALNSYSFNYLSLWFSSCFASVSTIQLQPSCWGSGHAADCYLRPLENVVYFHCQVLDYFNFQVGGHFFEVPIKLCRACTCYFYPLDAYIIRLTCFCLD